MNTPLVSIITVTYNTEKYIEQTVQSVVAQTYPNIEYIVVDGVSTDSTLQIIKNNFQLVSEKDNGIYDAMNKGIALAKGELIGIINADDFYDFNIIFIYEKIKIF